ncbi:MAG: hypothetical protein EA423_01535 [Phycisphaerales bacterium]|nr:MAG: hypothetical protein EA423_01535 [Phycisphaerales bacterium]
MSDTTAKPQTRGSTEQTVVLKFGSSVLRSPADLPRVAAEIERRRDRGRTPVVAIVSAFRGRTDELLAGAGTRSRFDTGGPALASLLSVGEIEASALLALEIERAGIHAELVPPERVGVIASDACIEGEPVQTDPRWVLGALRRAGVAVVPGFVSRTRDGRPALLGRGGSDLTAVCLAAALGARCVLVKDTGAVHEWDPAEGGPAPKRFATLTFEDALALGDRVIQPRAIRWAQRLGRPFTVAGLGADGGTLVGAERTTTTDERETDEPRAFAAVHARPQSQGRASTTTGQARSEHAS